MLNKNILDRGTRQLIGENLKLVWAEFSNLHEHVPTSTVENSAQV
jgi:hypothetical protein